MAAYLWIAAGGAIGSVARFWLSGFVARQLGGLFPWGTLIVNVTGSFAVGLFAAMIATASEGRWLAGLSARQFFITGFCGGYTTFSAFSLQTLGLARDGQWFLLGANAVLSVALCLIAVWLGHLLGILLTSKSV